jgi:hypothetical protein
MKMVQVQFERRLKSGVKRHTTAWVDGSWKLRPGKIVEFESQEDVQWVVVSVGTIVQEYEEINRAWRVGGL